MRGRAKETRVTFARLVPLCGEADSRRDSQAREDVLCRGWGRGGVFILSFVLVLADGGAFVCEMVGV